MPGRNARIFMTAGMLSLLLIYVQGSPIIRTINPLWLAFFALGAAALVAMLARQQSRLGAAPFGASPGSNGWGVGPLISGDDDMVLPILDERISENSSDPTDAKLRAVILAGRRIYAENADRGLKKQFLDAVCSSPEVLALAERPNYDSVRKIIDGTHPSLAARLQGCTF